MDTIDTNASEAKRGPGRPRKEEAVEEAAPVPSVPKGFDVCYAGLPGKVFNADGRRVAAGEQIIAPIKTVDALEARGLAFRDVNEAKANFTTYKRKKEAERQARIEAMERREENRKRWAKALGEEDSAEWNG